MRRTRWGWSAVWGFALFGGCTDPGTDPGALFTAEARTLASIEGHLLETTLRIHNDRDETRTFVRGGCWSGRVLRLYDPTRPARPVWDGAVPPGAACALVRIELPVPPGGTEALVRQDRVQELLGDSLPPGPYRVTLTPSFQGFNGPEIDLGVFRLDP